MRALISISILMFSLQSLAFSLVADGLKGFANAEIPIDYNPTSCPAGIDLESLLTDAIAIWNDVPNSKLKLSLGNVTTATAAAYPPVAFCDSTMTGSAGGVGDPYWNTNMVLVQGRFRINTNPAAPGYALNLNHDAHLIITAHEIGHVLGLGHSDDSRALMYWSITGREEFNLGQDDMDAVAFLYPRDELKNDPLMGGCGLVGKLPPASGHLALLLFLPLMIWALVRFRQAQKLGALRFESHR